VNIFQKAKAAIKGVIARYQGVTVNERPRATPIVTRRTRRTWTTMPGLLAWMGVSGKFLRATPDARGRSGCLRHDQQQRAAKRAKLAGRALRTWHSKYFGRARAKAEALRGTYVGPNPELRGLTALVSVINPHQVAVQFDDLRHKKIAHGWHKFPRAHFDCGILRAPSEVA
jgi:hypothetical protein